MALPLLPGDVDRRFTAEAVAFDLGTRRFVTQRVLGPLPGRWLGFPRRGRAADGRRLWISVHDHGLVSQWTDEPRPVAARWEDLELQHGTIAKADPYGNLLDPEHLLSLWTHELTGPRMVRFTDPMPGLGEIVPFITSRHTAAIS